MCVLAQVLQPMRLTLPFFVYHDLKTLVILQVCHKATEEIETAVFHIRKEILTAALGYFTIHIDQVCTY